MPSGPSPLPELPDPSSAAASPDEREFDRLLSIAYALQSFRNLKSTGWMQDANGKTETPEPPSSDQSKAKPD
jgi:hypothetical protein